VGDESTREWRILQCMCRVFSWVKTPEGEEFWRKLAYVLKARIDLDTSKNFQGCTYWNLKRDEPFSFRYERSLRRIEDILFSERGHLDDFELLLLEYLQLRLENLSLNIV
jgi:hypothetical protein